MSRYAQSLGIETTTGKPYKPTTQGKSECFHQTLFRWLNTQPLVGTLDQFQAQLDEFDALYNDRPHQGLPQRQSPNQAWNATASATPPRPSLHPIHHTENSQTKQTLLASPRSEAVAPHIPGQRLQTVFRTGSICVNDTLYYIANALRRQGVIVIWDGNGLIITIINGEIVTECDWEQTKTKYVGKTKARHHTPPTKTKCHRCPGT